MAVLTLGVRFRTNIWSSIVSVQQDSTGSTLFSAWMRSEQLGQTHNKLRQNRPQKTWAGLATLCFARLCAGR
ncbi:hypothetical protein ACG1BZ_13815 [Microbulbifer sp. CNSA002]|uniref:hypothetical protein n=1 Tax=Microbulbifer sp. CNSA002 TaxID=3373604 RepID=UPI0039B6708D